MLVVEPDPDVSAAVGVELERTGYDTTTASTANTALDTLWEERFDLVLIDLAADDTDAVDVVGALAEAGLSVIVTGNRSSADDRVRALQAGAADYLAKPTSPREVVARVEAVLRRARVCEQGMLRFGGLEIDRVGRRVFVDGTEVRLTRREFDLLVALAGRPQTARRREELLREVWASEPYEQQIETVTEHVRRLRRKLGEDARSPRHLKTVHGVGYRFDP